MYARATYRLAEWYRSAGAWFAERAHGKWAKAWLFILSYTESSFSVVAPDILLVAMLLVNSRQWIFYAVFTTFAGILGALFGYAAAAFFYDAIGAQIVAFYGIEQEMLAVYQLFEESAFLTIFLAAFTPIPYKLFVLAAGFFKINIWVFLAASILGRLLRYLLIGFVIDRYGSYALRLLTRYFTTSAVVITVVLFVYILKIFLFS